MTVDVRGLMDGLHVHIAPVMLGGGTGLRDAPLTRRA